MPAWESAISKDERTGEFFFMPFRNSPAAKAGLKFGDRIVAVDDQDVTSLSSIEVANYCAGRKTQLFV